MLCLQIARPDLALHISWFGTALAVGYAAYLTYTTSKQRQSGQFAHMAEKSSMVNPAIKKDEPKVVDSIDVEDLGNKSVFCRCWRSKKFPYCDGSHVKHNKECNDNVGPLIIQRREIQA